MCKGTKVIERERQCGRRRVSEQQHSKRKFHQHPTWVFNFLTAAHCSWQWGLGLGFGFGYDSRVASTRNTRVWAEADKLTAGRLRQAYVTSHMQKGIGNWEQQQRVHSRHLQKELSHNINRNSDSNTATKLDNATKFQQTSYSSSSSSSSLPSPASGIAAYKVRRESDRQTGRQPQTGTQRNLHTGAKGREAGRGRQQPSACMRQKLWMKPKISAGQDREQCRATAGNNNTDEQMLSTESGDEEVKELYIKCGRLLWFLFLKYML